MKVKELLADLEGADPDAEVIVADGGDHMFFDPTESEWRRMVHITWVDDSTGWWPPEQLTDDDRSVVKATAEHYVLVLQ